MTVYSSDNMLATVTARQERDTRVNVHQSSITVRAEHTEIMLEGRVDNIAERRAAIDTVTRTLLERGRWPVIDRLYVKPTEHKQNPELKEAISLALGNEPVFWDYSLLTKLPDHMLV